MDDGAASTIPPVPRYSRHPRRREDRDRSVSNDVVSPASPEVISSLITSLSVISRPASQHFDQPITGLALSFPSSPRSPSSPISGSFNGSFGVDYGAFSQPSLDRLREEGADLDELAASPPIIRTSKPPSGFSPLTAPRSPSIKEGGLKSILSGRSSASRPSSKGSSASRDADTQSIGNLSVERAAALPGSPPQELRGRRSHDSWGRKASRSQKGLMYMSSKERLRERELEKRVSGGAVGGSTGLALSLGRATSPRPDPFLAETPITEEPSLHHGSSTMAQELAAAFGDSGATSPRPIPTRDSSLRKPGSSGNKRASARVSRSSKRDSDAGAHDAIPESEEQHRSSSRTDQRGDASTKRHSSRNDAQQAGMGRSRSAAARSSSQTLGQELAAYYHTDTELDIEDGAPSPAVAQGRRRDRELSSDRSARRRSGRLTPEPLENLRPKRSSSRLKRLSAPLSPRTEDKPTAPPPEPANNVGYERPRSADSVDDAVESYLCSPRLSQKIKHPQTGRVISFSEVGDSEGSAVFCCVGMGLTRYITAFYDELALTLKLRLITPDRPGVGDSEAYADGTATPLSWPDDVYAICQALKINKFSILAHSAGAIYALATALRMPQHIRGRIHLLAPWIPPSQMSVFGASAQTPLPPTNAIPTSQRILRALPTPFLKAANSSFMTATSSSITSSLPKTQRRGRRKASDRNRDSTATKSSGKAAAAGVENKENRHGGKSTGDAPELTRGMNVTEEMDRVRPDNTSPTGTSPLGSAVSQAKSGHGIGGGGGGGGAAHRKTASNASAGAAHARQEAAILAAAQDALADKERQMTYDLRLTHAIWELATTGANPAVDLLVCLERRHTIGFRYVDITRPVVIHHGSRDTRVPVENVKWLGKTMRRCEVRVLEGEGHGLMASAAVMGGVLMEISKEWDDWSKATGAAGHRGRDAEKDRRRGTVGAR